MESTTEQTAVVVHVDPADPVVRVAQQLERQRIVDLLGGLLAHRDDPTAESRYKSAITDGVHRKDMAEKYGASPDGRGW